MRRILLSVAVATAAIVPLATTAHATGRAAPPPKPRFLVHNLNLGTGHPGDENISLKSFHETFEAGGQSYGYYMVGDDPFTSPNATSTINTTIIPININLDSGNGAGDFNASN